MVFPFATNMQMGIFMQKLSLINTVLKIIISIAIKKGTVEYAVFTGRVYKKTE